MPVDRTPVIAGNWKMNCTGPEALVLVRELITAIGDHDGVEVVVAPPFTALSAVAPELEATEIGLAGQTMHWEPDGAFTGEISAPMLLAAEAGWVILGHSERRMLFGETDEALAKKVPAALEAGLIPILCVGESEAEREAGKTHDVLKTQIEDDLAGVDPARIPDVVVAYEPVWAIGTGRVASAEDAQEVCSALRAALAAAYGEAIAAGVRVLYGGSVKAKNVGEIAAKPDVDGALVGGASLDADEFAQLCAITAGGPLP